MPLMWPSYDELWYVRDFVQWFICVGFIPSLVSIINTAKVKRVPWEENSYVIFSYIEN